MKMKNSRKLKNRHQLKFQIKKVKLNNGTKIKAMLIIKLKNGDGTKIINIKIRKQPNLALLRVKKNGEITKIHKSQPNKIKLGEKTKKTKDGVESNSKKPNKKIKNKMNNHKDRRSKASQHKNKAQKQKKINSKQNKITEINKESKNQLNKQENQMKDGEEDKIAKGTMENNKASTKAKRTIIVDTKGIKMVTTVIKKVINMGTVDKLTDMPTTKNFDKYDNLAYPYSLFFINFNEYNFQQIMRIYAQMLLQVRGP